MKTRLFHPDESLDRNPTDDGAKFHLPVGVVNEAGYTHAIDVDMCCRPQYTRLLYVTWDMGMASSFAFIYAPRWCPRWGSLLVAQIATSGMRRDRWRADHIKDVMADGPIPIYSPSFLKPTPGVLEMGIIVSCLAGIVACFGECIIGIIGAIVDCLECVISGAPIIIIITFLRLSWAASDERRTAIIGLFTGIVDCICDCLCCG